MTRPLLDPGARACLIHCPHNGVVYIDLWYTLAIWDDYGCCSSPILNPLVEIAGPRAEPYLLSGVTIPS